MKKLLLSLAILIVVAGCATKDAKEQAPAGVEERKPLVFEPPKAEPTVKQPVIKPPVEATTKPVIEKPVVSNPLTDPGNILSKRSIFFEYDSFSVKEEFKPLVVAHAQYLTRNRSAKMVIQGNTDERGSREYNIALGQKRADSIKQMMILLGAQESQIETVSFGEEKPRASGSDESAFSQNRRGDIVYAGE